MMFENEREDNAKESIVRYIRVEGLEGDFLLYAIPVKEDFKLVLLYDSEKSFSIARRQAKYVSQLILTQDPSNLPPPETGVIIEETAVPITQPQDSTLPSDWIPQSPASVEDFPQLTELDIPPADPEIGILEEAVISAPVASELPPLPTDWFPKRPTPSSHLPFLTPDEPNDHSMVEGQVDNEDQHEARYHLPFSAVLVPFLQAHRLDDTLAEKVRTWVQDICIAWGWRAEDVQTSPDYLRLTLNLSPDTAPSTAIHHLATALSKQILTTNLDFSKDLPSDQFWAKHYLLIAGEEIGIERIQTFVEATRQDPGTSPLGSD
jgi:REP element-mobilizing transposase RayT